MKKHYDCGIDLGTTNSCIAVPNDDNTCTIIGNNDRMNVTPSVVWINRTGRITVGQKAYTCTEKGQVRKEFKRDMGTDAVYEFAGSGLKMTPVELSAEVLKSVRSDAGRRTGREMTDAVITVPAAFSTVQSEATKEAAKLAGFRHVILLQEPIAAAVAYGAKPGAENQNWLVFDYGGGTLDVAIVSTHGGRLTTVNNKGHNRMGGKDLDRALYENIVLPKLREKYTIHDDGNEVTRARIMDAVEACKMELSNMEDTVFEIFDVQDDAGNEIEFSCDVTREEYNRVIEDILQDTIDIAQDALAGAAPQYRDIHRVILVGGSTGTPYLKELIQRELVKDKDIRIDSALDPMTVVAQGAALFAASSFVEVEEEGEADDADGASAQDQPSGTDAAMSLELKYDDVVYKTNARITGKFKGADIATIDRYSIACLGDGDAKTEIWSGGAAGLDDPETGVFMTTVNIVRENGVNHYRITATDKAGNDIPLKNAEFKIIHKEHGLKNSAPPLPFNVGVLTTDGTENYIDWLLEKNTGLPATVTRTYRLNKTLDPQKQDTFHILVYEGEDKYNEDADFLAGDVHVRSRDLPGVLHENSDIELTIEIDESRCMTVRAFAKALNHTITSEQLRKSEENYLSFPKRLDDLIRKINDEIMKTIGELGRSGVDVKKEREQCIELKRRCDDQARKEIDNDEIDRLSDEFNELKSAVLEKKRGSKEATKQRSLQEDVDIYISDVDRYGTKEDVERFKEFRKELETAQSDEEREYIRNRMNRYRVDQVLWKSFDFLKNRLRFHIESNGRYKDAEKASYWMDRGSKAAENKDFRELKDCVNELDRLRIWDSGNEGSDHLADLKSV
ncbi:MAG: Hsp70 family protein [Lachnospiraceae bacterium]|nr:Hsp70 family protein [Lachnospiraceae bacterium]